MSSSPNPIFLYLAFLLDKGVCTSLFPYFVVMNVLNLVKGELLSSDFFCQETV